MRRTVLSTFLFVAILGLACMGVAVPGKADELKHPIVLKPKCQEHFETYLTHAQGGSSVWYYSSWAYVSGSRGYACGWMGRADQSTKFKGMFVHPSGMMQIAGRHLEITKARMVITSDNNNDPMTLKFAAPGADASLAAAVEASIQTGLKLRGSAELVEADSLPDDGLAIEDARSYE